MSFESLKMTHYLKLMRYYSASIENICYHNPLLIMTQSIGLYDHFRVLPISQSLLLILAKTQYPLKIESPCSIVAW